MKTFPDSKSFRVSQGIYGILYLFLIVLSFYFLIESRTSEAQTVWQVMHPSFIPTLLVTTVVLSAMIFSSENTMAKLLFVIIYSILIHSFFSIVFPAGDLSGQQMVLGRTRRVFDNTILHGFSGWPNKTILVFIFDMFRGTNLQAALSTIFARMLSIDILYVHLFLIPVLWGVFVPIGAFLITKEIGGNEKASVLSSFLVSAFPFATYFGAISVPNSLGFIFFLYSLYFTLKYFSSEDSKTIFWIVTFSFFSFLSHFSTGIMSISLLLLALAFKAYKSEKRTPTLTAKILLSVTFTVSLSFLPLSFVYLRFFGSTTYGFFTLDKLFELPPDQIVGLFTLGELIHGFDLRTIILFVVGPIIASLYLLYLLFKTSRNHALKIHASFLFLILAFLIMLIDYRILKLFMEGLPLNPERLWVFRDLIAAPFVATAIYSVVSSLKSFLKSVYPPRMSHASLGGLSKGNVLRISGLLFTLNVLIPAILGGWVTLSLGAAYPQVAPLQTTSHELDAVKYIDKNTNEKYVVIGDRWTIYAGEVIVGINNPNAYYFAESNKLGYDLFVNMSEDPSPRWMLSAMNYTQTTKAYFIITESRVRTQEDFNNIITRAQETSLTLFYVSLNKKLYVYSYSNATSL